MKFLYDFFPILLFFIAYKTFDIYVATAVAMISSVVQVGAFWLKHRRVETMHLVTLVSIMVLGSITLLLHDETFIKWKPTVVEWAFAIAFLISQFVGEKTLVQRMMESSIQLTDNKIWTHLNLAWIGFFIAMGALNLYIAFNYPTDVWVNFKLFGMMGFTFVFVLAQGFYMMKYIVAEEPELPSKPETPNPHNQA
jgi:intracellular septation protein